MKISKSLFALPVLAAGLATAARADSATLTRADIAVFCQDGKAVIPEGLLAHVSNDGIAPYTVDYRIPSNLAARQILSKQPTRTLWLQILKYDPTAEQKFEDSLNQLCSQE